MPSYSFKRIYHPKLGRFVYKHKGSGLIVDNIFKPLSKMTGKIVQPLAKKALKSGIERAKKGVAKSDDVIMKKSGDLIMKKLHCSTKTKTKTPKVEQEDYNIILNRLISGNGVKKVKKNLR